MTQASSPKGKKLLNKKFFLKAGLYFVGFIVFVLLMDNVIMPLYTKHGKEYELPDVTARPVQEAIEILKADGFQPIIQDSTYDEQFPPETVVQQNPLPFSLVKKGRRVYLTVSIGEKPRFMPRLIDLTPQDARFLLEENELQLNNVIYEFSELHPKGVVINQSIPPGEPVKKNQRVNITVSLGPPPTSLEIPNLVGKSVESAKKELDAVGVKVGRIKYVYRPNLVPGTVINQSVSAGTNATKVDSVDLAVSTDQPPQEEESVDTTTQQ